MASVPTKPSNGHAAPSTLDRYEQAAKIFATTAVPIVIAIGGWALQSAIEDDKQQAAKIQREQQSALERDKISLEYVKIAKDILTSSETHIPSELTKWSWRLLDGVSPVKFDKADLKKLIERGERIPPPTKSLAPDYKQMFKDLIVTVSNDKLDSPIDRILTNKARYVTVGKATGVPWFVIAILHYIGTDLDFTQHLNGDPLSHRTVHVPRGRPRDGKPPFSWEESVRDTIIIQGLSGASEWNLEQVLYNLERSNGFGYRRRNINSPYLWNCTSLYTMGYYVSDHVFDPIAKPRRCGAAALLKRMIDRKLIALE